MNIFQRFILNILYDNILLKMANWFFYSDMNYSYAGINYKVSWDLWFEQAKREYIENIKERFEEFKDKSNEEIIACLKSTPRASGIGKFKSHQRRNQHT
jgi:hypothetical protein